LLPPQFTHPLCTGNELVAPGNPVRDDQIFESTSFALMSLVRAWGGKAVFAGVEKDSLKGIAKALRKVETDLIVTVGGASVGDYDLVKPALLSIGYDPSFDKVDLRPGRPTSFGKLKGGPFVLGLPGNPASALVCAQLFLKPFIQTALSRHIDRQEMNLPCLDVLPRNSARQAYLRAKIVRDTKGCPALKPFVD
jgi:molybdopterin molybdotransferase